MLNRQALISRSWLRDNFIVEIDVGGATVHAQRKLRFAVQEQEEGVHDTVPVIEGDHPIDHDGPVAVLQPQFIEEVARGHAYRTLTVSMIVLSAASTTA